MTAKARKGTELPVASRFEVAPQALRSEVQFYNEAGEVYDHLEQLKSRIHKQNREFDMLMEYFVRNRGHIDLEYRSSTRLGTAAQHPNLGTTDPSWYYVDERGNRIWVRNLTLDSVKAASYGGRGTNRTGAFEETVVADNRHVVVKVPPPKRHYNLPADYRRRCVEAEAEWATRPDVPNAAHWGGPLRAASATGWTASPYGTLAAARSDDEAYIEAQRLLAQSVRDGVVEWERTYRLPSTIAEAEQRLAELRAEESQLLQRIQTQK
jgi:hypothetical protein